LVVEISPELDERLDRIEKMLRELVIEKAKPIPGDEGGRFYTAPEFQKTYKCGYQKLQALVQSGHVKRIDAFGKIPRYQVTGNWA
jgi:hypothetical protein